MCARLNATTAKAAILTRAFSYIGISGNPFQPDYRFRYKVYYSQRIYLPIPSHHIC
jgi:hypothetical protein